MTKERLAHLAGLVTFNIATEQEIEEHNRLLLDGVASKPEINLQRYGVKREIIALLEQMSDEELAALLQELREKGFWWVPAEERNT